MSEITCPKCHKPQLPAKNNLCSYCFFNLLEHDPLAKSVDTQNFDNLNNHEIRNILKLDEKEKELDKIKFYFRIAVILILSITAFVFDNLLFPLSISGDKIFKIVLFLSLITTYGIYRYMAKKYNMTQFIATTFSTTRSGRPTTPAEQNFSFFVLFFIINFFVNFFSLSAINDFTSVIFQSKTHNVFINSKEQIRVKGGYIYYLDLISWKRDNSTIIRLKMPKKEWDKYVEGKSALIKIKPGIFEDVIWNIGPNP